MQYHIVAPFLQLSVVIFRFFLHILGVLLTMGAVYKGFKNPWCYCPSVDAVCLNIARWRRLATHTWLPVDSRSQIVTTQPKSETCRWRYCLPLRTSRFVIVLASSCRFASEYIADLSSQVHIVVSIVYDAKK